METDAYQLTGETEFDIDREFAEMLATMALHKRYRYLRQDPADFEAEQIPRGYN